MSTIDNVKRIIVQDFKQEDQETVAKLAGTLNYFMEQVTNTINGRLDIDNTDRELIEIEVTVDSNGVPYRGAKFSSTSGFRGSKVVRAINKTSSSTYPTSCPFLTFYGNGQGLYTISNIAGLQADNKYVLLIELIP